MTKRKEKIKAMQQTLNILNEKYFDGGNDFKTNYEHSQAYKVISKIIKELKKLEDENIRT